MLADKVSDSQKFALSNLYCVYSGFGPRCIIYSCVYHCKRQRKLKVAIILPVVIYDKI